MKLQRIAQIKLKEQRKTKREIKQEMRTRGNTQEIDLISFKREDEIL